MQRPPWRIVGDSVELVLTTWGDDRVEGQRRLDPLAAERLLYRLLAPASRVGDGERALLEAARYVVDHHAVRLGARPRDPRAIVAAALHRGLLEAWSVEKRRRPRGGGEGEASEGDEPAVGAHVQKTWIEIELTDMEGNAMPGERYWIKLPDGTIHEGALDAQGRAYFGDLDPGSAEIRWPDRDGDATLSPGPLGQGEVRGSDGAPGGVATRAGPRTWVEIELLDMAGQPVPHERYWIRLPDGSVREGALDAMGLAYFDDLDPGQCTIRWLGRDEEAAFLEPDATAPGPTDRVAAQVEALVSAARDGVPFCEECERARREREAAEAEGAEA
jgi:hypothetical protein